MFVLDTNVISELRSGKPSPSPEVRSWAASVPAAQLFLSAITILELELGVLQLERRTPPQGSALRAWLHALRDGFEGRVLAFTEVTAVVCAGLNVPDRKSERDAMIAATAIDHGFTLVTRNVSDFSATGAKLFNPWELRPA